jgi:hypothetical protein
MGEWLLSRGDRLRVAKARHEVPGQPPSRRDGRSHCQSFGPYDPRKTHTGLKPWADALAKLTASGGARTHNLRLRRPTLYPVELRTRIARMVSRLLGGVKHSRQELRPYVGRSISEACCGRHGRLISGGDVAGAATRQARLRRSFALPGIKEDEFEDKDDGRRKRPH